MVVSREDGIARREGFRRETGGCLSRQGGVERDLIKHGRDCDRGGSDWMSLGREHQAGDWPLQTGKKKTRLQQEGRG